MIRSEKYEAILTIPGEVIDRNPFEAASIEKELGRRISDALISKLNGHEKIVRLGEVEEQPQTDFYFTAYKQMVVVEDLVRCKNCLFWEAETETFGVCPGSLGTHSDDYCSKGRRTDASNG